MSDRDPDIGCAVLHKDSEGRTVPCPGDHPMPPPELSEVDQLRADNESLRYQIEWARWALGTDEQPHVHAALQAVIDLARQIPRIVSEASQPDRYALAPPPAAEEGPACSDTPNCDGSCCKRAESGDSLRDLVRDTIGVEMDPLAEPEWADLLVRACRQLQKAGPDDIQGRCPACGNTRLFLGEGGYVTCPRIDCPEPDAASTLLADPQCPAETEVPGGTRKARCVMPRRHDDFHADSTGLRWGEEGLLNGPGQALLSFRRDDWMRTVRVLGVLSVACGILAVVATTAASGGDSDAVEAALAAAGAGAILAWAAFSIWRGERG